VPADGRVAEGSSELDRSMVTGESRLVAVEEGDEVIAGTVNGSRTLTVEVSKTGEDSYLSQVMRMVQEAQQIRSCSQNLADRSAFWLTLIVLSVGTLTEGRFAVSDLIPLAAEAPEVLRLAAGRSSCPCPQSSSP
jgi:Cu2+-exporting ATPase